MSTQPAEPTSHSGAADQPTSPLLVALAWLIVAIPLAYGLWQTLIKAFQLLGW
ncbi:MAG: hypothetical protein JWR85_2128 [Marmoricola sp.]|nr:hypothetical protein [Marmoricola sp.]